MLRSLDTEAIRGRHFTIPLYHIYIANIFSYDYQIFDTAIEVSQNPVAPSRLKVSHEQSEI